MLKKSRTSQSRLMSGIVGGILLGLAGIWLGWLLIYQHGGPNLSILPIIGGIAAPTYPPVTQASLLLAEGITLGQPTQAPALSKQQALLIASQWEPDAATKARSTSAQYVLLNYHSISTPATHPDLNNVPAWMILYQKIPLQSTDTSVDPTPSLQSSHDLYVFLDANSGKELLVIWV